MTNAQDDGDQQPKGFEDMDERALALMKGLLDAHDGDVVAATVDWTAIQRASDAALERELESVRNWVPGERFGIGTKPGNVEDHLSPNERQRLKAMRNLPTFGALRKNKLSREGERGERYRATALEGECTRVASTQAGERNNVLASASFKLGQLVPDGLDEDEATDRLLDAARDAGLSDREARATIRSGLRSGQSKPRAS